MVNLSWPNVIRAFTVAVSLSQTGVQIILFRTFLGIAISMCLPTAMSLITNTFTKSNWRNLAFASNGMGEPLGFSVRLILGVSYIYRYNRLERDVLYECDDQYAISMCSIWVLLAIYRPSDKSWRRRLIEDIDGVGAVVLSAVLGILLYVLAMTIS